MTIKELLWIGRVELVGSIKNKESPRDIDMVLIIPDHIFVDRYGSIKDFLKDKFTGNYSNNTLKWNSDVIEVGNIINKRLSVVYGDKGKSIIDLKILPEVLHNNYFLYWD
jgi:hypothetical protein